MYCLINTGKLFVTYRNIHYIHIYFNRDTIMIFYVKSMFSIIYNVTWLVSWLYVMYQYFFSKSICSCITH